MLLSLDWKTEKEKDHLCWDQHRGMRKVPGLWDEAGGWEGAWELNVCFSQVRRAESLKICLRDTQEDTRPCTGLVQTKAEPSLIWTDWILQRGKPSHRLVQRH